MKNSEFNTTKTDQDPQVMQLYDFCAPALPSGSYTLKSTQQVIWDAEEIDQKYEKEQEINVRGPRFTIDGAVVHSVFPPPNGNGRFQDNLPHVVLNKRTLPWERTYNDAAPTDPPVQWMALLLLDESEIDGVRNTTVRSLIEPGEGVLGPQGLQDVTAEELDALCYAVDIPRATFERVAPRLEELPFLAHCREVDMSFKEIHDGNAEGWFSVVLGNRFPRTGANNIACLVSIEGFGDVLNGSFPAEYSTVRMAVLAFWNFFAKEAEGENFKRLMEQLDVGLLQMPQKPESTDPEASVILDDAFTGGFTPLDYLSRQGESSVAWYRGPFTPVVVQPSEWEPFFSAEAAMIYDKRTGMFDLSYAVAWQIGRLLALSDREFSVSLYKWRLQELRNQDLFLELEKAADRVGVLELPSDPDTLKLGNLVMDQTTRFFAEKLAAKIAPRVAKNDALFLSRDPSGLEESEAELPGVLDRQQLLEVLSDSRPLIESLRAKIFERQSH